MSCAKIDVTLAPIQIKFNWFLVQEFDKNLNVNIPFVSTKTSLRFIAFPNYTRESWFIFGSFSFNLLNPELNPICYLLALLGTHHFLHVNRIRVKLLTFRRLMSYIYGAPILDVSRSHTTTQHSR